MLPEAFEFEIIRYYTNFSESIIQQLNYIQNYSSDSSNSKKMLELMEILENNYIRVCINIYRKKISREICFM